MAIPHVLYHGLLATKTIAVAATHNLTIQDKIYGIPPVLVELLSDLPQKGLVDRIPRHNKGPMILTLG